MTPPPSLFEVLAAADGGADLDSIVRAWGPFGPDDARGLIDHAAGLIGDDPHLAGRLLELAIARADPQTPTRARARYLYAQTRAALGEPGLALRSIEAAAAEYDALGLDADVLRTNLGRTHVLTELGRHEEAMAAARSVLAGVDGPGIPPDVAEVLRPMAWHSLALCHELAGEFTEALAAYEEAEAGYVNAGDDGSVGAVVYDRALVLVALGRLTEALAAFGAAVRTFSQAGLRSHLATVLTDQAEVHLLRGEYHLAIDALLEVREHLEGMEAPVRQCARLLMTARAHLALNLFPEALDAFDEAGAWLRAAGMQAELGQARWGSGLALAALDRPADAAVAFDEASLLLTVAGHPQWQARVGLEQARLFARQGSVGSAGAAAQSALALAEANECLVEEVHAHLLLAELGGEDPDQGPSGHLDTALGNAERTGLAGPRVAALRARGAHRLRAGRLDDARRDLEDAAAGIDGLRGSLGHDALLGMFLADKFDVHVDLVRLELATGSSPDVVLAATERARARSLADLVAGVVTAGVAGRAGQREELETELGSVYTALFDGEREPEQVERLRERAGELERRVSRLRLDALDRTAARSAAMASGTGGVGTAPAPPAGVDLTISYVEVDTELIALVGTPDGEWHLVRGVAQLDEVRELRRRLQVQLDRVSADRTFAERHEAQLELATRRVLGALYDTLVRPLEALLPDRGRILVVRSRELRGVPFAALHDGLDYLVERFAVVSTPSLAVFAGCTAAAERSGSTRPPLVVGVADERAPNVEREAIAVAARRPGSTLALGPDATVASFVERAPGSALVHLACHGMYRADNPMFSALRLTDGWLTAADVIALDLHGATVVLSACESGRHGIAAGDEVIGFTRAFLGAGACTLVSSLWHADDATTADLMVEWYDRLPEEGPAESLRLAQQLVRRRHPHPFHWAAFAAAGAP